MVKRRRTAGVTLIELMVAVAIVAILASIAYPSYRDQIIKSRRAEGKGLLLDTAQALEKCKTLYGAYDATNAGGAYLCGVVTNITGGNTIASTEGAYSVSATAAPGPATYEIQAVPQQTDPQCGTLTIDQAGKLDESGSGTVDDCW